MVSRIEEREGLPKDGTTNVDKAQLRLGTLSIIVVSSAHSGRNVELAQQEADVLAIESQSWRQTRMRNRINSLRVE